MLCLKMGLAVVVFRGICWESRLAETDKSPDSGNRFLPSQTTAHYHFCGSYAQFVKKFSRRRNG